MPTVPAETRRGMRLLPGLTAGQTLGLLATVAAVRAVWAVPLVGPLRVAAAGTVALAGAAYSAGRWPPGPDGERLAAWLPRLSRYVLHPRRRAGQALVGWGGLQELGEAGLRHAGGWVTAVACCGPDWLARGPEAGAAAQVAYRELLQAAEAPLQVVGASRRPQPAECPSCWDPAVAPPALRAIAGWYRGHWGDLVADQRLVVRTCLFLLPAGDGALPAALERFALRLGWEARSVRGPELVALLLASGGSGAAVAAAAQPGLRVRGTGV